MRFMPHGVKHLLYHVSYHWCELDMSCLKNLKQVRFGVKTVLLVWKLIFM